MMTYIEALEASSQWFSDKILTSTSENVGLQSLKKNQAEACNITTLYWWWVPETTLIESSPHTLLRKKCNQDFLMATYQFTRCLVKILSWWIPNCLIVSLICCTLPLSFHCSKHHFIPMRQHIMTLFSYIVHGVMRIDRKRNTRSEWAFLHCFLGNNT